jgi:uncharacterized protein (DUF1800 family)
MTEFEQALDLIAGHPSTSRFISRKLLQLLVTDDPGEALIDEMVLVWNDGTNPHGIGDLRELTRKALSLGLDPAMVGTKIKTPFEQFVTSMRALKANTNGLYEILDSLTETQHLPFFNEVPTGYSEVGGDWIATGGIESRQSFGRNLASSLPTITWGSNPVALLNSRGISTDPGDQNESEIVDFFSEILFGGALTQVERQTAIQFLSTDFNGNPSPYDDGRIRSLVAILLGFPQFMEQ